MTRNGFTLVELMIVIAIIGVLVAIAIPQSQYYIERVRYAGVLENMRNMDLEIRMFEIEHGRFPDSLAEIQLDHIKDPWGHPFEYLNHDTVKGVGKVRKNRNLVPVNNDYDLYSKGPDGASQSPFTAKASQDDIVRANDGAFFGRVSDY